MDKRKYNRVPEDTSQQQMFVEETIDAINELEEKPAGTKLYKHTFTETIGEDSITWVFISTDSTPYTKQTLRDAFIAHKILSGYTDNPVAGVRTHILWDMNANNISWVVSTTSILIESYNYPSDSVEDVVTEL